MTRTLRQLCRCGMRFVYRKQLNEHIKLEHPKVYLKHTLNKDGKRGISRVVKPDPKEDPSLT